MLMKDPKKGMAALIAKKLGSPEVSEAPKSEMGGEEDNSLGHKVAAEEVMRAIETKDATMLVEALKSFIQMCEAEEEMSEDSEEPKY